MKQPKKFTREQKSYVANNLLNVNDWAYIGDTEDNRLKIINKKTNEIIDIKKYTKKKKLAS